MSALAAAELPKSRPKIAFFPWWMWMLGVAAAGGIADVALKLWAVSELPYMRGTHGLFGVELYLVFNRTPSFDYEHFVISQALPVVIKFLALGYLGSRLKGWWRWLGLGLILGGAIANVGNWAVTGAVPDFLVMPWATVNLADLLIVIGAVVICSGWAARGLCLLTRSSLHAVERKGMSRPETRGQAPGVLGTMVHLGTGCHARAVTRPKAIHYSKTCSTRGGTSTASRPTALLR
jgi:lipoprotein signal peptidase